MNMAEKIRLSECMCLFTSILMGLLLCSKIYTHTYNIETLIILLVTLLTILINSYLSDIEEEYYKVIDDIRRTTYRYEKIVKEKQRK